MKKVFLLLASSVFAMSATAQQTTSIVLKSGQDHSRVGARANPRHVNTATISAPTLVGAKTTIGPGGARWYNYINEVLATNSSVATVTNFRGFSIWQDTTALFGFTPTGGSPTYYHNPFLSVGLGFDPFVAAYNDLSLEGFGLIKITPTDAYTIDSVAVFGSYERSSDPSKTGVTDTLIVSLVYGNGGITSNLPEYFFYGMLADYGVDTVYFLSMIHDTAKNTAGRNPLGAAPAPITVKVPLTATDSAITFVRVVPITLAVPAGNYAAAAVSFKTGDPTWMPFDTVLRADGSYKYHSYSSNYSISGTASTPAFPPYNPNDHTAGYWKRASYDDSDWDNFYQPNWNWSTSTGASDLQYPYILFNVTCATCDTIRDVTSVKNVYKNLTAVNAYPNPASDEVTISFNLANKSDVIITLTDVVGQVISRQFSKAIAGGKATINTSSLPNGVYLYTVEANRERRIGRVTVTH